MQSKVRLFGTMYLIAMSDRGTVQEWKDLSNVHSVCCWYRYVILFYSRYRQCPNRTDLQKTLMRKIPLGLKSCYVDETTHPPYRKPMKKLLYLFNATNALEPTGSIMTTQIDHYAVGKDRCCVTLTFVPNVFPAHFPSLHFCTCFLFLSFLVQMQCYFCQTNPIILPHILDV